MVTPHQNLTDTWRMHNAVPPNGVNLKLITRLQMRRISYKPWYYARESLRGCKTRSERILLTSTAKYNKNKRRNLGWRISDKVWARVTVKASSSRAVKTEVCMQHDLYSTTRQVNVTGVSGGKPWNRHRKRVWAWCVVSDVHDARGQRENQGLRALNLTNHCRRCLQ